MPTYPYACTVCDNQFEVVQAFTDDALTVCDVCGGRLRKVFSSVGVVFKGSGFYRNDSRSASGATGEGSGSSESTTSADSSGESTSSPGKTSGDGGSSTEKPAAAKPSAPAASPAPATSAPSTAKGSAA